MRQALTPDYRVGCKRLCPSNDFYPAFNRANVELVTDPIASTGLSDAGRPGSTIPKPVAGATR
jgi:cation diffusion facilitator CzcD-associated flavoprotein CzcO